MLCVRRLSSLRPLRALAVAHHQRSFSAAVRQKVVTLEDAVAIVHDNDTICCSGFVGQGAPEALLKALGDRYQATGHPSGLTVLFGGGPGDWGTRGLNHLGKQIKDGPEGTTKDMIKRTIGAHYGQVPVLERLALDNKVQAYSLPMGSISKMIRAAAGHTPGHFTTIGMNTFVDPRNGGGKINDLARTEGIDMVTEMEVDGARYLFYRALPINVTFIRATTADAEGNLTFEKESLLSDQRVMAMAARNSGGVVVAQVERIAAVGSLPTRAVGVPGVLVDCVVRVDPESENNCGMSFFTRYNSSWSHEIRQPLDSLATLEMSERKIIARRAAQLLRPGRVVNLGIGMPEGVAAVAAEEMLLSHITLTTEAGAIGGMPSSGKEFGPSANALALQEMNSQFDFYDGGGLDVCYLGMAQTTAKGDVNVSRLEKNRITGPGGFIDISQATRNVIFMGTFTAKGLDVTSGDGKLHIVKEGSIKKFVNETLEVTFSGDEAVRRGQHVLYITERAVFRRTARHPVLELIEIAPGMDVEKDILANMEFTPVVSPNLKTMDPIIFRDLPMDMQAGFASLHMRDRFRYEDSTHCVFLDLSGITISTKKDIAELIQGIAELLKPLVDANGPVHMVVNYDGFDCKTELENDYHKAVADLESKYYSSVRRYTGTAFQRFRLMQNLPMDKLSEEEVFDKFDHDAQGCLSVLNIRKGIFKLYGFKPTNVQLQRFMVNHDEEGVIPKEHFTKILRELLEDLGFKKNEDN